MDASEGFESLYHQLAHAWEAHQSLRRSQAVVGELAESSFRLHEARLAMWNWRCFNTLEGH